MLIFCLSSNTSDNNLNLNLNDLEISKLNVLIKSINYSRTFVDFADCY